MFSALASIALIAISPLVVQDAATSFSPAKILKEEVDGLVHTLRASANADGSLGDGSARDTAMALAALGQCHRFYWQGDGPWLRRALAALFAHRRGDGAFVDRGGDPATTTRWALAAFEAMDPEGLSAEIASARAVLQRLGVAATSPLTDAVVALHDEAMASATPMQLIKARAAAAQTRDRATGGADASATAQTLLALVTCQMVARGAGQRAKAIPTPEPWSPAQERGFLFLLTQQQDGVFYVAAGDKRFPDVGLTGIALAAAQTKPRALRSEAEQATIARGLAWLIAQQGEDGAFGQQNVNYATSASVMALAAAKDERFRQSLAKAQRFLLSIQNAEQRGFARSDRDYGSIGYGGDERGDLSNLQFAVEALRATELSEQDEAFQRALVFLQRTQNHTTNDFEERVRFEEDGSFHKIKPGDDGGSAYYPGNSPAGYIELEDGSRIPRSYGSMTYALLKTYLLCGLPPTDTRVRAAVRWITSHWTLAENPGADAKLGRKAAFQGLYYYYMVMAQALALVDVDTIEMPGKDKAAAAKIDWRAELRGHLEKTQRDDGSWLNTENERWWENIPMVCTVYALLALDRCQR